MAKFPSLPLFTDAFISDTVHLNAAQTGAYLMLLMVAWRADDCRLPDDDKILSRYARMSLRQWLPNKLVIMAFWKKDKNNNWYQSRLVDERTYADDKRNKNVIAGKVSALKRHNTSPTDVPTSRQHKGNEPLTRNPKELNKIYTCDFETFWKAYPKREGSNPKQPALAKFTAAVKAGTDPKSIITGAYAYHAQMTESGDVGSKFVAQAVTWLNQERWNDDMQPEKGRRDGYIGM